MKLYRLLIIVICAALLGYFYGTREVKLQWKEYKPIAEIVPKAPPSAQTLNMSLFYDVVNKINADYYDKTKIDAGKLMEGAISGMLQSLGDPYTSFFPPRENQSFKTQLAGEFQGIGAELGMSPENKIVVISPLDGSPSQKAGVQSGDTILTVDGKDTSGWTLPQAVEKIRGPKGTTVTLLLQRIKEKSSKEVKIVRDVIVVKSVSAWVKQVECEKQECKVVPDCISCKSIGYMRLSQFGDKTNAEWIGAVNSLNTMLKQQKNFSGIVFDLRNNPGGYLSDAVFIASEFLQDGTVVIQEGSDGEKKEMRVSRRGLLTQYPLVILANKGSASASEIVAAALSDHKRAKVVGERTFGKGTIQEAIDLTGGSSVHISVAKWLTPNGTWVDKEGIKPDIEVPYDASSSAVLKNGGEVGFDNQLNRAVLELLRK